MIKWVAQLFIVLVLEASAVAEEMEHHHDRLFALAETAHQVVSHTRADCGDDADEQIKSGYARVETLKHEHTGESYPVEEPVPRPHVLAQNKDADEHGENRREILDRDGGSERHALQCDEEGEEGKRAKGARAISSV